MVVASRGRTLEASIRSGSFRLGRVQRRRQSRPAVEQKRCYRHIGADVSQKRRFPRNAEVRRVNHRSLQILSTAWSDVTNNWAGNRAQRFTIDGGAIPVNRFW